MLETNRASVAASTGGRGLHRAIGTCATRNEHVMRVREHCKAVAASDLRVRWGTLCLRDQISAFNPLHEAALQPERAEDLSSHHDQNIPLDPIDSRLSSPIN